MLCVVNTLLCAMFRPANAEKKEFSKTKIGKLICIYTKAMDSVNSQKSLKIWILNFRH